MDEEAMRDVALSRFVVHLSPDGKDPASSSPEADHLMIAEWERLWHDMGDAALMPRSTPYRHRRTLHVVAPASRRARTRAATGLAIAASVLLILAGSVPFTPQVDIETGNARRVVRLPDGSRLWLDANTAVTLDYNTNARRLTLLAGRIEAVVAANPMRPFTVGSDGGTITALGTRFVVAQDGAGTDVIVTEHRVRLVLADGSSAIVPAGYARRYGPGGPAPPRRVNADAATAWTRGWLRFDDRPLGDVVDELSRRRPGWIALFGPGLADRRVSGMIALDDPERSLRSLQISFGLRTMSIGSTFIILYR